MSERTERQKEYWKKNVTMTLILLAIWAIITYLVGYYAWYMNRLDIEYGVAEGEDD